MTLSNFEFSNSLEFKEGRINTLVMENPVFYRNTVLKMKEQINGGNEEFFLYKNGQKEDFVKNTELITDIFGLKFDTKPLNTKIIQALKDETDLADDETFEIITKLNMFASELANKLAFDVSFKELTDLKEVIKLFEFFLDVETLNFCEKITEYMDVISSFSNKKLFVFLNLKSALTEEETEYFIKNAVYKKYSVLLLENKAQERIWENEKLTVIDRDLCEIT